MHMRLIACTLIAAALAVSSAFAQNNPLRGPEDQTPAAAPQGQNPLAGPQDQNRPADARGQNGAAAPDQPVRQQVPRLIQRPAEEQPAGRQPTPPQPPPAPFTLTPEEQAEVDRVLKAWEDHNRTIETFDCDFKRWIFNVVFAQRGQPLKAQFVEQGVIKFAAPDRGLFRIDTEEKDGKQVAIDQLRAEHWLCDGTSIYQYLPQKKQVVEHRLPPELRGKAIANSPLPFLFGAEAQNLKQRYFIRLLAPPQGVTNQIWLEAYPRFQQDAANFSCATLIISTKDLSPVGLELVQPNKKDFVRYSFDNISVNAKFRFFKGNPFKVFTPWGWQLVPDQTQQPPGPAGQAQRDSNGGRR